jgi:excisionase family DNA binding protein
MQSIAVFTVKLTAHGKEPRSLTFEPYTLSIKDASAYFGISEDTLYHLVSNGAICRGLHYLKFGRKTLIVREEFIRWLEEQDGSTFQTGVSVS